MKRNTDHGSLTKVWVYSSIRPKLYYDTCSSNARPNTQNSVEATLNYIKKSMEKALAEGYQDVVVRPDFYSDDDQSDRHFIHLEGWRIESDHEFMQRLEGMYNARIRALQSASERVAEVSKPEYVEKTNQIKTILDTLKI